MTGFPRLFLALVALVLLGAACTSSSGETVAADTSTPVDDASEATEPPATTTTEATSTTAEATTSTLPPVRAPLTGEIFEDEPSALERPALLAKIDNDQKARPQVGLAEADIVFEMLVEASITRLGAVFHSRLPDPIGPLRSSRTSDFDLLQSLNTPLYASSGGNAGTMSRLTRVAAVDVTQNRLNSPYFRDRSRNGPHNLFVPAPALYDFVTEASGAPTPWFQYRADGESVENAGEEITGAVSVRFSQRRFVTHQWDTALRGWARTQDGTPHTDLLGDQLAPENVVIMVTTYGTSPADSTSPELNSTGSGDLYVLTDGVLIEGEWIRENATDPPELTDVDGEPILLTPGRTWVLFPKNGDVAVPA